VEVSLEARQKLTQIVRKARGAKSQRAYARLIGVTGTTVGAWEDMRSFPEMDNLAEIAKTAGYSLADLLDLLGVEGDDDDSLSVNQIVSRIKGLPLRQLGIITEAVSARLLEA
jgi:transcriptional regulator with XRE-family HTH domain